jgi:nicotinate-nucleotide adenylyltransferase
VSVNSSSPFKKIGIFGGTFDPIHYAHLFIAEQAYAQYELDKVLFVPNATPPHKRRMKISSAELRCEMVRLAIQDNPHFELSLIEQSRPGNSYTVDTLNQLHDHFEGCELFFISGTDAISELATWHMPERILHLATILVAERRGFSYARLGEKLPAHYMAKILRLKGERCAISATQIRRLIKSNLPVKYLTPDPVVEYISKRGLYR